MCILHPYIKDTPKTFPVNTEHQRRLIAVSYLRANTCAQPQESKAAWKTEHKRGTSCVMDESQGDKSRQATAESCMIRQREIKRTPSTATAQGGGAIV